MATPVYSGDPTLTFGVFELSLQTGELHKSGHKIALRPQAAKVLIMLATRAGQLVTREELKDEIWGRETFVDFEHGLNLCIRQIRAALDDDADTPRYIETLPRRGYRFIAPVRTATSQPANGSALAASQPFPQVPPLTHSAGRRFFWSGVGLFAAIALAIVAALVITNPAEWRARWLGAASGPAHTIAVLPLQNLSGDPAQDYFADGMTDALTTDLARMETVQVISRSSTMQYKTVKKPLPVIARELHADAIVEGSVQRSGNRVRITAQLIRAATDKHLWAETYERDFRDILTLQDDVAAAIARQVAVKLGGRQPLAAPRPQAVSPEAYETYLKANYYLDQFDLQKSIEHYSQAIKLDPNYAPSYAHMARAYFFLGFFGEVPPKQAWGKVKELATLAVAKDGNLPEAHGAMALGKLHYDWDFAGAEQEFKRALELNPSNADIRHDYAHYLMAMGRMDESAAESKRAVDLDPVDDGLFDCLCWHSFAARQYDNSIKLANELLARQPNDTWELAILAWDYEQKGMFEQAVNEFQKANGLTAKGGGLFNSFFLAGLGHAYALAGRRKDAEQVLGTLLQRRQTSYVSAFDVALIYAALGEKDAAFRWLETAVAERSTFLVNSKWEPRLDPLRSDARFKQTLQQAGLPI